MRGQPIDLDEMHRQLFEKADHFGRLRISQKDYAKELGLVHETVCRCLTKMAAQGRLKRIKSGKSNVGTYHIIDPEVWASQN